MSKVLNVIEKANLKIKGSKCVFAADSINFLGHIISSEGIKQDPKKLESLTKLPIPKNVKEMRRVLGMLGYYRKFIKNFSLIAEPLTRLTKKDVEFKWEEEQQKAFDCLIEQLKANATLVHFDHKNETRLKTDASKAGVAGILLQLSDDEWKLVACCSRRLSSSEENYGITDLEGLAIIYAVNKFRPYLLGKKFEILVDHCALCVLNKRTPASPRLRRWAIVLSEFDFEIKYVKGVL